LIRSRIYDEDARCTDTSSLLECYSSTTQRSTSATTWAGLLCLGHRRMGRLKVVQLLLEHGASMRRPWKDCGADSVEEATAWRPSNCYLSTRENLHTQPTTGHLRRRYCCHGLYPSSSLSWVSPSYSPPPPLTWRSTVGLRAYPQQNMCFRLSPSPSHHGRERAILRR
jgi:hypothetical protein